MQKKARGVRCWQAMQEAPAPAHGEHQAEQQTVVRLGQLETESIEC